jgi:DNA (cytosine-5)-methyltransferase 1
MNRPSIFSFFAGAGFLDLGFEATGYHVAYVNEIHAPFMKTYRHSRQVLHLPEPEYGFFEGDITSLLSDRASEIESLVSESTRKTDLVGFIGGPPCPDFSVGGKNRGRTGDNGKLSATYVNLICLQKPAFFLFENVKGLWKTKKHRAFYDEMKQKLHDHGYVTTERLINTLEYGVPQHRERIILIGFRVDVVHDLGYQVNGNTLPDGCFPWEKYILYPADQVFSYPWSTTDPFEEDSVRPCPEGIPVELTVEYWFRQNEVQTHPNASQYFQPRAGLSKFAVIDEGDDSKKSYKRLHRWRYSPTAAYGNNEVHLHPYKMRRISVAEALAIQSLPKEYTLPLDMTLTDAFKTVGNGVPYLAAKAIAQTILDFLGVSKCSDSQPQTLSQQSENYQGIVLTTM